MELKKIKLTKLFGIFNHEIVLQKKGGITLVLGENGLGKTVILKMLKIVFEQNYSELRNYDFGRFDLEFNDFKYSFFGPTENDQSRLVVSKYKGINKIESVNLDTLPLKYRSRSHVVYQDSLFDEYDDDFIVQSRSLAEFNHIIEKYLNHRVTRVGNNDWLDQRTGRILKTQRILSKYGNSLPKRYHELLSNSRIPKWLVEFSERVNIYLIETQRLRTKKSSDSYQEAVITISSELSKTVKGLLATANEIASQLDRTYPNRLLSKINELEDISDEELSEKLDLLEKRRVRLREVGLIDPVDSDLRIGPAEKTEDRTSDQSSLIRNVLLVYIQDSNDKLDTYDEIANKLEVFVKILNERLNVKQIIIDREEGLRIVSSKGSKKIPLKGLSSGEQHMIILFYNLLFKCKKGSMILIDEPEISLHIIWQNNFIKDLKKIQEITPFKAIIATHSPDIINDNWDLTTELFED